MSGRSDDVLRELQDPATWDETSDVILPPVERARAVAPVSFDREEFARLAEFSRAHGVQMAEFVRQAALDRLAREDEQGTVVGAARGARS